MGKNLKTNWMYKNINTFVMFCLSIFVLLMFSVTMLFFREIYLVGIVLIIVEIILFFIVMLFVENISILYKIEYNEEGFSITKFSKVKKTIKWGDIVSVSLIDKFKMGKFIQVMTHSDKILIEYRQKIKILFDSYRPDLEIKK